MNAAPAVLAGVLIATLLATLPLGLALRSALRAHLGDSVAADTVASGVNWDWWQEFSAQATGLGGTFSPSVIGAGVVLDNLSALLDNRPTAGILIGVATAYLLLWVFLVGGVLDRYARGRATRAAGFFGACGVYFFRFLRLAVVGWLAYAVLFGLIHGWLLDDFYGWATRDFTVERSAFLLRVALYVLFGALLVACNLVLDYAKIRAVVEDRRSMIGALLAAWRFVTRRPLQVVGPLSAEWPRVPPRPGGVRGGGPRRRRHGTLHVGRLPDRAGVHSGPALDEAAVLCLPDGALSGGAGARRVHRCA